MGLSIYKVNEQIEEIVAQCIDPETGEIIEGYEQMFDVLNHKKFDMVEHLALKVINLKHEKEAIKKEREKLQSRERSTENRISWLKKILSKHLDGEKLKTERVSVYYKASQSLHVPDAFKNNPEEAYRKLGAKYVNRDTTYKINNSALREQLETANKTVLSKHGFELVEKRTVVVR